MPRLRNVFPADTVGTPAAAGLEENPQGRLRRSAERGLRREQANPPRSALQVSAHCDVCGVNKLCAAACLPETAGTHGVRRVLWQKVCLLPGGLPQRGDVHLAEALPDDGGMLRRAADRPFSASPA